MKRLSLCLTLVFATLGMTELASAQQDANIEPEMKCHYRVDKKGFCRKFPNISLRRNLCNPQPAMLGHIEWCREDVTITERDDHGNDDTYDAVVITYRPVYANGGWGKKFKRTYRKEPTLVTPALLGKNVVK